MTARRILLTGGGRGLGREIALALAKEGHRLLLTSTSEDTLRDTVKECRDLGADADYVLENLAIAGGPERLAERALAHFDTVDILVNNAGLGINTVSQDYLTNPYRFWQSDRATIEHFFQVNTVAPMLLAIALVAGMRAQGWGRIVSDTTSLDTMLRTSLYGGSKAGLKAEMAVMASDLRGSGVTANVLVPGGGCGSRMTDDMGIPRDKVLPPEIMGPPMVFLASDLANDFNGRRIQARLWDPKLPPLEASKIAGDVIAWTGAGIQGLQPEIANASKPGQF